MLLEKKITNWMESYNRNGYLNGSILVAVKGKVIVNKGFGLANQEHLIPNTSYTKYRIGSLTKAFTAFGILQLHDKGSLHIHDSIDTYLPDYPNGNRITIYHCLTNTSGIPNYTSFPDFWLRSMRLPSTLEQLIDSFKNHESEFEPGTECSYSNSGYALLTAIIEKVSGKSYSDYIKEEICHPLGMFNTGCDDGVKVVPNLASGYSFWEQPIHSAYADLSFPLGSYGLYSTTEDLYIWDQALKSSKLLKKETMEIMFTPNLDSYACGWMISEFLGRRCEHHFGDISGFVSDFLRFVDEDVTIIFLSNQGVTPVTHLTQEVAKVMFGEEVTLPIQAMPINLTNFDRFTGKYVIENDSNRILEISTRNEELYITVPKMYGVRYRFKLVPVQQGENEITFLTEMIHERIVFRFSQSEEVEIIEYTDFHGKSYVVTNKE